MQTQPKTTREKETRLKTKQKVTTHEKEEKNTPRQTKYKKSADPTAQTLVPRKWELSSTESDTITRTITEKDAKKL